MQMFGTKMYLNMIDIRVKLEIIALQTINGVSHCLSKYAVVPRILFSFFLVSVKIPYSLYLSLLSVL